MPDRTAEVYTLQSSTAVAAATQTSAAAVADKHEAIICIDVTGIGTSFVATVECSHNGSTWFALTKTWTKQDMTSVTTISTTGQYIAQVTNFGAYLRVNISSVSGSSTYSITAQAKN